MGVNPRLLAPVRRRAVPGQRPLAWPPPRQLLMTQDPVIHSVTGAPPTISALAAATSLATAISAEPNAGVEATGSSSSRRLQPLVPMPHETSEPIDVQWCGGARAGTAPCRWPLRPSAPHALSSGIERRGRVQADEEV